MVTRQVQSANSAAAFCDFPNTLLALTDKDHRPLQKVAINILQAVMYKDATFCLEPPFEPFDCLVADPPTDQNCGQHESPRRCRGKKARRKQSRKTLGNKSYPLINSNSSIG